MNFAQAVERETKFTKTENGAVALNTTGNACLDLYSTIEVLEMQNYQEFCPCLTKHTKKIRYLLQKSYLRKRCKRWIRRKKSFPRSDSSYGLRIP